MTKFTVGGNAVGRGRASDGKTCPPHRGGIRYYEPSTGIDFCKAVGRERTVPEAGRCRADLNSACSAARRATAVQPMTTAPMTANMCRQTGEGTPRSESWSTTL